MGRITKEKRALIISLIEQDLIYFRFMSTLGAIQLIADSFVLEIDEIILQQAGIADHEDIDNIYDHYMQLSKKAIGFETENLQGDIHKLAVEIWQYLEQFTQK